MCPCCPVEVFLLFPHSNLLLAICACIPGVRLLPWPQHMHTHYNKYSKRHMKMDVSFSCILLHKDLYCTAMHALHLLGPHRRSSQCLKMQKNCVFVLVAFLWLSKTRIDCPKSVLNCSWVLFRCTDITSPWPTVSILLLSFLAYPLFVSRKSSSLLFWDTGRMWKLEWWFAGLDNMSTLVHKGNWVLPNWICSLVSSTWGTQTAHICMERYNILFDFM